MIRYSVICNYIKHNICFYFLYIIFVYFRGSFFLLLIFSPFSLLAATNTISKISFSFSFIFCSSCYLVNTSSSSCIRRLHHTLFSKTIRKCFTEPRELSSHHTLTERTSIRRRSCRSVLSSHEVEIISWKYAHFPE